MSSAIHPTTTDLAGEWRTALEEFLLHMEATRAKNTHLFYAVQLRGLLAWAEKEQVGFRDFRKRHFDRFLVSRSGEGRRPTTVHHSAACTKSFFHWCVANDFLERDPLAEYRVRNAPHPARPMPTEEDVRTLLKALGEFWDIRKNPGVKFMTAAKRSFHRDRNTAIYMGLLDSACRIGEMLNLKVEDYEPDERRLLIRESKGREPRTLPVSPAWADALTTWLRVRRRVMNGQTDEGWLFVSEFGGPVDANRFIRNLRKLTEYAELSESITLHSLRRFSINRLAKVNLLAAQTIAGHKDTKTTLLYTKLDPDFLRQVHGEVGVLRSLIESKRETRRRVIS